MWQVSCWKWAIQKKTVGVNFQRNQRWLGETKKVSVEDLPWNKVVLAENQDDTVWHNYRRDLPEKDYSKTKVEVRGEILLMTSLREKLKFFCPIGPSIMQFKTRERGGQNILQSEGQSVGGCNSADQQQPPWRGGWSWFIWTWHPRWNSHKPEDMQTRQVEELSEAHCILANGL